LPVVLEALEKLRLLVFRNGRSTMTIMILGSGVRVRNHGLVCGGNVGE
jgi:hypothetical protein